jgi:signal peptide peptidase SppA
MNEAHFYPRLAARLFNTPLLLEAGKADMYATVFNAFCARTQEALPEYTPPERVDLAASINARRADGGYYLTNNGIAIVQIFGAMVQRADALDALSGMTGYNDISARMDAAGRDPSVKGIIMEMDSPGGEVEGVIDAATRIAEIGKPVWAHANGIALSGGYWLAATADRILASPTGLLGSIGVLIMHADRSQIIARSGVVYTPIFAGKMKAMGRPDQPLSEEHRSWAQERVDEVYTLFVDHVAGNRGISAQQVRDTEAEIYGAPRAVELGLADGVALLGETVQMMADEIYNGGLKRKEPYRRAAASAFSEGEDVMDPKQTAAANPQPAAITQADLDAARAAGASEAETRLAAKAKADAEQATAAAKLRIKGIEESDEGKKRPALAKRLAFDSDMSVEAAVALMKGCPEEVVKAAPPTNALAERMEGVQNPVVGAEGSDGNGEEDATAMGKRIASFARNKPLRVVK